MFLLGVLDFKVYILHIFFMMVRHKIWQLSEMELVDDWWLWLKDHMGLDTIKPVFWVLQIRAVGPDLFCSPFGKINFLASLCSLADLLKHDLIWNPEYRFTH